MTEAVGYAPFSREELDLASKEQLMEWCQEYGLDESGLKYELRLRLLEHIRKQNLLLKGEKPETAMAEAEEPEQEAEEQVVLEERGPSSGTVEVVVQEDQSTACPTCGMELTYIPQYDRWYCYNCQRYAPVGPKARPRRQPVMAQAGRAAKIKHEARGSPMAGVSLALAGLLMYIADQILFRVPAIFDIPVLLTAPEIDFALQFLSTVFITLGIITAVLLVAPRS